MTIDPGRVNALPADTPVLRICAWQIRPADYQRSEAPRAAMPSSQTSLQSLRVRVMPTFTDAGPSAGHPRAPVRVLATLDFDNADHSQAQ